MHQEVSKKENICLFHIILCILGSGILLILFNYLLNMLFNHASVVDLLTILAATWIGYVLIRNYFLFYKYQLIEEDLIIREVLGSKEKIRLNINVHQIKKMKSKKHKDYKTDKKRKYFSKNRMYNGENTKEGYYCIYTDFDKEYYFEIQPSKKMLEIITKKNEKLMTKC